MNDNRTSAINVEYIFVDCKPICIRLFDCNTYKIKESEMSND
jgi:hypothetical protein